VTTSRGIETTDRVHKHHTRTLGRVILKFKSNHLGHKQFYKLQTFLEQDQEDLDRSDQHSGAKNLSKAIFDFCMKIIFFHHSGL
jgi:hypothetical protein